MSRPRFPLSHPVETPRGDEDRVCIVCHRFVSYGDGVAHWELKSIVCQGECADLARRSHYIYDRSTRGRLRPIAEVRRLVNGARCASCENEGAA
jgi:hypothetical protein